MKLSYYNIFTDYLGKKVIFNSRSGSAISETDKRFHLLQNFNAKISGASANDYKELMDDCFIVPEDADEQNVVLEKRMADLYSDEVVRIMVVTSYDCNFACRYCTQKHRKGTDISDEDIDRILEHLERWTDANVTCKTVNLHLFGGEPLCNTQGCCRLIDGMRRICDDCGKEFAVNITTNGSIIRRDLLQALREVRSYFQITVDGWRERHDANRPFINGRGSFDCILSNVRKIYDELPLSTIRIRINYDNECLKNINRIIPLFADYDRKRLKICLEPIIKDGNEINPDFVRTAKQILSFFHFEQPEAFAKGPCIMNYKNSVLVNHDGQIHKCMNSEAGFIVGNIGDADLFADQKYREGLRNLPVRCISCRLLPLCKGPCIRNLLKNRDEFKCNMCDNAENVVKSIIKSRIIKTNNR